MPLKRLPTKLAPKPFYDTYDKSCTFERKEQTLSSMMETYQSLQQRSSYVRRAQLRPNLQAGVVIPVVIYKVHVVALWNNKTGALTESASVQANGWRESVKPVALDVAMCTYILRGVVFPIKPCIQLSKTAARYRHPARPEAALFLVLHK